VVILIRLRLTRLGNRGSNPNRQKACISSRNAQKGPASLSSSCLVGTMYRNGRDVKLTTLYQVVPRLMHGTLHSLFRMSL